MRKQFTGTTPIGGVRMHRFWKTMPGWREPLGLQADRVVGWGGFEGTGGKSEFFFSMHLRSLIVRSIRVQDDYGRLRASLAGPASAGRSPDR